MGILRNVRHEHFVRCYIANGGNGAEAYRAISSKFPARRPLMNRNSASVIAHWIRKRPEVRRREQELRRVMAKKSDITMDKVLTDIEQAIEMAKAQAKPNDLVNAAMAQAKLVGHLRERTEIGQPGDFDGLEDISDILEKLAADAGPEAALAVAKAFGYAKDDLEKAIPPTDAVN